MYLHIGQNVVVPTDEIVGIFDIDNTTGSRITRDFLKRAEEAGNTVNISDDLPRTFVLRSGGRGGEARIYLTQLAAATLHRRRDLTGRPIF
ncbi:MAG: DUF370 domain-containing protein [Oscillospiraceae bacterium]|jgi:hypothetical protein|nr:DUF370 domain-containing protein [Oscillospiraceae bacterium]